MRKKYLVCSVTVVIFLMIGIQFACAQEEPVKAKLDLSSDFMSRYIWRGLNLGGSSPSIQPTLEFSYGNFAIGAWGAYSISHAITRQEMDLYASYTIADLFNIGITDYYLPFEDTNVNEYFNYGKDETGHVLELSAKFLGTEAIPLSLMVATNVYGADARKANGDLQLSTYVELNYNFQVKETDCTLFLGFTPTKPDTDNGEGWYYSDKPGIINLGISGSKEIPITDKFSLPVNASLITNPQAGNIFLVFGFSL
jgi:uncharacterized protein (TIGR02001 family)